MFLLCSIYLEILLLIILLLYWYIQFFINRLWHKFVLGLPNLSTNHLRLPHTLAWFVKRYYFIVYHTSAPLPLSALWRGRERTPFAFKTGIMSKMAVSRVGSTRTPCFNGRGRRQRWPGRKMQRPPPRSFASAVVRKRRAVRSCFDIHRALYR